jgi:hypothetical protein
MALAIPAAALLFAACGDSSTRRGDSSTRRGDSPTDRGAAPSLGSAQPFGVLAGATVTCAGPVGAINADVGLSPGSAITGFPTCTISGTQSIANARAAAAQGDLTAAFNALAGLACGTTISADLGGTTLAPGVYCSASSVGVTGVVTFDGKGDSNATFVVQAGSALTVAGSVTLIGSAQAKNVYWQVGSSASLGTGSAMKGNILALTSISLNSNATLLGRALARNGAVSLVSDNSISLP